jgi:hypothetical protein
MRCLAILAVGLLGDQPTRNGAEGRSLNVGRELMSRVKASDDFEEQVALLTAMGLQARGTVSPDTIDVLRHLAATGVYARRGRGAHVQGQAMIALARLTGPDASGTLLRFVRGRGGDAILRQAGMVGIGIAARRLTPLARVAAAAELAVHAERGNPDTVGLALLTLGRLIAAAMQDPTDGLTMASPAASLLLTQIAEAPGTARRVAALATGIALRGTPVPGAEAAWAAFRRRAIGVLCAADEDGADPPCEARRSSRSACAGPRVDRAVHRLVARHNVSPLAPRGGSGWLATAARRPDAPREPSRRERRRGATEAAQASVPRRHGGPARAPRRPAQRQADTVRAARPRPWAPPPADRREAADPFASDRRRTPRARDRGGGLGS